jgi:hypothetical protein
VEYVSAEEYELLVAVISGASAIWYVVLICAAVNSSAGAEQTVCPRFFAEREADARLAATPADFEEDEEAAIRLATGVTGVTGEEDTVGVVAAAGGSRTLNARVNGGLSEDKGDDSSPLDFKSNDEKGCCFCLVFKAGLDIFLYNQIHFYSRILIYAGEKRYVVHLTKMCYVRNKKYWNNQYFLIHTGCCNVYWGR